MAICPPLIPSDALQNRVIYFFFVPKIKFIVHMGSHIGYIICLSFTLSDKRTRNSNGLMPNIQAIEVFAARKS